MTDMDNGEYKLDVEKRLTYLHTTVTEIKDNHLPHIQSKVDWIFYLVITTLVGVVVSFLVGN